MSECRDESRYAQTVTAFNAMLSANLNTPRLIEHFEQFGTHGYSLGLTEEHITFLRELNNGLVPISGAFDPEMIRRWETVNELLIESYAPKLQIQERLRLEFSGLAALVAFPLLEEMARRISASWNEEGLLSIDLPEALGLLRTNSKGVRVSKSYKKGERLVDLAHKLLVMKSTLSNEFQQTIESLDKRMSVSRIKGLEMQQVTFFERMEYLRNMWLHGRKFEGVEAWLVTFFLAMLYFRLPQSDQDGERAATWARLRANVI